MHEIARKLTDGLLYFPSTPFKEGRVDTKKLSTTVENRMQYAPGAVFVGCGTGEFFALNQAEYTAAVEAVVAARGDKIPVVAGCGYGNSLGLEYAHSAAEAGAEALLAFPPGGPSGGQAGLKAHFNDLADRSPLPLVLYQRGNNVLSVQSVVSLCTHENIIGIKDGTGNLESMARIRQTVGDRWAYFNGTYTAEVSAAAYAAIGAPAYSSAVFAFFPEIAKKFFDAFTAGNQKECSLLLNLFFIPFADLRDRHPGYGIALIKAGLGLRNDPYGEVRPPLSMPSSRDLKDLKDLIQRAEKEIGIV